MSQIAVINSPLAPTVSPIGILMSDGSINTSSYADVNAQNTFAQIQKVAGLVGNSAAPVITPGSTSILGTGATVSVTGTNLSGVITLNTGSGLSLGLGKVMNMTYAGGFAFPGGSVITFAPANANFAGMMGRLYVTGLTNGSDLYVTSIALSASTTYIGTYTTSGW